MEDRGPYRIFSSAAGMRRCRCVLSAPGRHPSPQEHEVLHEDKLDMGYQKYQAIKEAYPGVPENDAAMLSVVEHCYPYLMQDTERRAKMEACRV